jgi:hypothetical protein
MTCRHHHQFSGKYLYNCVNLVNIVNLEQVTVEYDVLLKCNCVAAGRDVGNSVQHFQDLEGSAEVISSDAEEKRNRFLQSQVK